MSFYIGFVTKDLIALAADRKFKNYNNSRFLKRRKLIQIDKTTWGVHIGAKFFGEKWLYFFKFFKRTKYLPEIISIAPFSIWHSYKYYQKKLKLKGSTNIAISGFDKEGSFIYALDSINRFQSQICRGGSIYSCLDEIEQPADRYIKRVTEALGKIQNEDINRRIDLLRKITKKIFKYLSKKYESISLDGDMVFITRDGSVEESFS